MNKYSKKETTAVSFRDHACSSRSKPLTADIKQKRLDGSAGCPG